MEQTHQINSLSDTKLVNRVKALVADEQKLLADFLTHLAEMDTRRLHTKLGFPSLFKYCVDELGLSEDAAYKRITGARLLRRFPVILPHIATGKLHLAGLAVLGPILTQENHQELLQQAWHKTRREVEQIRASYAPQPDVHDVVRTLPTKPHTQASSQKITRPGASSDVRIDELPLLRAAEPCGPESVVATASPSLPTLARRDQIAPLSAHRVKIQFAASETLRTKLQRAKEVLWHTFPEGRLEDIFDAALEALLEKRDPGRRACRQAGKLARKQRRKEREREREPAFAKATAGKRLRVGTRHIPQWVKDQVWQRDHGECQFVGRNGKRCRESCALEFDHVQAWALGGRSDEPANIRLLCRAHNQLAGREVFGGHLGKRELEQL